MCSELYGQIIACNSSQVLCQESTQLYHLKDCTCYSAPTIDGLKASEILLERVKIVQQSIAYFNK